LQRLDPLLFGDSFEARANVPACSSGLVEKLIPDYLYAKLLDKNLYDVFVVEETKQPSYEFTNGAKLYHQDWTDMSFPDFDDENGWAKYLATVCNYLETAHLKILSVLLLTGLVTLC
jgi:predicted nucleotidyltransferase component of viral defense system